MGWGEGVYLQLPGSGRFCCGFYFVDVNFTRMGRFTRGNCSSLLRDESRRILFLRMKRISFLYYVALMLIVWVSWCFYASVNYPLLNSDDALNVLMAHYYSLPGDFYCWGQDRGGTLIPLISWVLMVVGGGSALVAVSMANYLLLVGGFWGFATLLASRWNRLMFALIWFLPFQRFIDLVRFPIGVQYSLLGLFIGLWGLPRVGGRLGGLWVHLQYLSMALVGIAAVWVSDLAWVTMLVMVGVWWWRGRGQSLPNGFLPMAYLGVSMAVGLGFLFYARSHASGITGTYAQVNDLAGIWRALGLVWHAVGELLVFRTGEPLVSLFVWLVFLMLFLLVFYFWRGRWWVLVGENRWIVFFGVDFLAVMLVLFLSGWVLRNGMGRWYFVSTYISLGLCTILVLELMRAERSSRYIRWLAWITVLIGSVSTFYSLRFERPGTFRPMASVVGEFGQLGRIGILAEYWNAYIAACPDPDNIKATPHEGSDVRNPALVEEVFSQPRLYVIRDMWLPAFPDTLTNFGRTLIKREAPFRLGGCDVCRYEVLR
jgi:hypothetical protein